MDSMKKLVSGTFCVENTRSSQASMNEKLLQFLSNT
jgi:hypothetical protein